MGYLLRYQSEFTNRRSQTFHTAYAVKLKGPKPLRSEHYTKQSRSDMTAQTTLIQGCNIPIASPSSPDALNAPNIPVPQATPSYKYSCELIRLRAPEKEPK